MLILRIPIEMAFLLVCFMPNLSGLPAYLRFMVRVGAQDLFHFLLLWKIEVRNLWECPGAKTQMETAKTRESQCLRPSRPLHLRTSHSTQVTRVSSAGRAQSAARLWDPAQRQKVVGSPGCAAQRNCSTVAQKNGQVRSKDLWLSNKKFSSWQRYAGNMSRASFAFVRGNYSHILDRSPCK